MEGNDIVYMINESGIEEFSVPSSTSLSPIREKFVMGRYVAGGQEVEIVFWGDRNDAPEQRELMLENNAITPQVLGTKRDIIVGGGMAAFKESWEGGKRIVEEVQMPAQYEDWLEQNAWECPVESLADDLLKHGNCWAEITRDMRGRPSKLKHHPARVVRAQRQNAAGKIPYYWLYGAWSAVSDIQKLSEVKSVEKIPAWEPGIFERNLKALWHGADRLLGGPYYWKPRWAGSENWMKVANSIPIFHNGNLENGFNIRYIIRVPEDYFLRALSEKQRKDEAQLPTHLAAAKKMFKEKLNTFLQGAENAGRGLIVTSYFYKQLQREWPELKIDPLEVDLKDEAMLALFDSSNQATTSAHGMPPILAGLATGAKMSSGNEVRNLYNFFQSTSAPSPRRILAQPYMLVWKMLCLPREIKLGFRDIELQTTDKNPEPQIDENATV